MLLSALRKIASNALVKQSHRWQRASPLRDVRLWDCSLDSAGGISIGKYSAAELSEEFGSPLLVVNTKRLQKDARDMMQAMQTAGKSSKVLYSYKTNCIPGILKEIHTTGIGAEVISPYELWLAKQLNVPGEMIIYNGVDKTYHSLCQAMEMNVLAINIDQREEVERICKAAKETGRTANVGVRLGLSDRSQFGVSIETGEALQICKEIASYPELLKLKCLHFSVTSNAKNSYTHRISADQALHFMKTIKQTLDLDIEYLDIGGGIGVPTTKNMSGFEYALYRTFGCLPKPADPDNFQPIGSYIREISEFIEKKCAALEIKVPGLLVEPGRFVTSRCGLLLSKVIAVKEKKDGTQFLITDAGRLSMTFPAEFEYHEIFVANKAGAKMDTNYQIMGRICTSADWLAKNRLLPKSEPGDIIAVMDAGAYFSSYSSTFAFPRPGIIGIDDDRVTVIRKAETFEYLTEMDNY